MDGPKHNLHMFVFLLFLLVFFLYCPTVGCRESIVNKSSSDPPSSSKSPHFKTGIRRILLSIALGAVAGLIGALVSAILVRSLVRYLYKTPALKGPVIFSPKIDPNTLQLALASENQLLGLSSLGKYYKTVLGNGLTVAVKRLEPFCETSLQRAQNKSAKRWVQRELEVIASLRDRNLMSLRAYVPEQDRFCLIYDYMPCGSLEDAMNRVKENQLQLGWECRLRIAIGLIKGLQYLHSFVPQVLHYNLKPTNVMLDAQFEPRLADCGLAKLMPNFERAQSGYSAPECFQNGRYTDRSDIFSFGMILGVLLTVRDPTEQFFFGETSSGGSLGQWLWHLLQAGEAREALDESIKGEEGQEDEMLMAVRIAVVCLSDMPAERPSSDELVHMLTQLLSFWS